MLSKKILQTAPPIESSYSTYIDRVDYVDAFIIKEINAELSAQEAYVMLFSSTSKWIRGLMSIRNRLVSAIGLKTVANSTKSEATILLEGSEMGIFEIYHVGDNEVIAGEKDKHLDFIVSVWKQEDKVTVSTLVKYHNLFGKIYMILISPLHKLIVKHIMRKLV